MVSGGRKSNDGDSGDSEGRYKVWWIMIVVYSGVVVVPVAIVRNAGLTGAAHSIPAVVVLPVPPSRTPCCRSVLPAGTTPHNPINLKLTYTSLDASISSSLLSSLS